MSSDFVEQLRDDFSAELKDSDPHTVINAYEEERHQAADRIEALERINREMPSILKYLEEEARPIGTENGLVPNKALILLNNLRMAVENTWIV
jgi:hypothetical protein